MFNTIGERIIYCRNLLKLDRKELSIQIGNSISLPTLARWELDTAIPSSNKLQILTNFFVRQGIKTSLEWLKKGEGYPPISLKLQQFDVEQFDELAYSTLFTIRNKIKQFYFHQITSNFFEPIISYGDYVGGLSESSRILMDKKLCFVNNAESFIVGFYNHKIKSIENFKGETKNVTKFKLIGEVQWVIRRP